MTEAIFSASPPPVAYR